MRSTDGAMDVYPAHARLLALVSAYGELVGRPVTWLDLVALVERLEAEASPAALGLEPLQRTADALADLVTDLRRLDLLQSGLDGSSVTPAGQDAAAAWNGRFAERRRAARDALVTMGIGPAADA